MEVNKEKEFIESLNKQRSTEEWSNAIKEMEEFLKDGEYRMLNRDWENLENKNTFKKVLVAIASVVFVVSTFVFPPILLLFLFGMVSTIVYIFVTVALMGMDFPKWINDIM